MKVIEVCGALKVHESRLSKLEESLETFIKEHAAWGRELEKKCDATWAAIEALRIISDQNTKAIATLTKTLNGLAYLVIIGVIGALLKLVLK